MHVIWRKEITWTGREKSHRLDCSCNLQLNFLCHTLIGMSSPFGKSLCIIHFYHTSIGLILSRRHPAIILNIRNKSIKRNKKYTRSTSSDECVVGRERERVSDWSFAQKILLRQHLILTFSSFFPIPKWCIHILRTISQVIVSHNNNVVKTRRLGYEY